MKYKKILAGILATTMVAGSSFTVFADQSGSTSGVGSLDIVEKSKVFKVVLPTVPEGGDTRFDYILDPTSVITKTDAAKYDGATFASGKTVYFKNAPASETAKASYSENSDKLTITNKSTVDVDVTVEASVSAVSGITMVSSGTFGGDSDTTASLYLALVDAEATPNTSAITTAQAAKLTKTIAGNETAYEPKYIDGKYVMVEKENPGTYNEYSFGLTGACNPKGVWTGLTDNPPVVDLVWTVKDTTTTAQISLADSGLITLSGLTKDANIVNGPTDITIGVGGALYGLNDSALTYDVDAWSAEDGGTLKIQLNDPYKEAYNGQKVTVVAKLTNGSVISCVETLNMP